MNEARRQGIETFSHLLLSRSSHGHHGSTVEGTLHSDDLKAIIAHESPGIESGQFYGRLIGLGPRIAKEHALSKGMLHQQFGKLYLRHYMIEVRYMKEGGGLLLNGLHNPRVTMTQATYSDTRPKIHILLPICIPYPNAPSSNQDHRITAIGSHKISLRQINPQRCFHLSPPHA